MKEEIILLQPELVPHHKIANEHRDMSEEEFESLKLSIEENGQLVPIITYKGKLVDGRHRQRALIELGIHDMKSIALPGNISLDDVRNKVIGTEMRRTDNPAQKAIRAYLFYRENKGKYTQEEVASKYGVNRTSLSLAGKLEGLAGIDFINRFYKNGYVYVGHGQNKKRYTNIQTVIRALKTTAEDIDDNEKDEIPETLSAVFANLSEMAKIEDIPSLSRVMLRAKNYINKLTGE